MEHYRHTQIGYLHLILYGAVLLWLGYATIVTDFNLFVIAGLIIMVIVSAIFTRLTVSVDGQMLKIQFGLGVIRKGFPLEDIEEYSVVKNRWYYGWGIRLTPHGWLFNIAGLSAVEIQMKSGKRYRIGTDDPDNLAKALDEVLNHTSR